jgi:hypothetical protein
MHERGGGLFACSDISLCGQLETIVVGCCDLLAFYALFGHDRARPAPIGWEILQLADRIFTLNNRRGILFSRRVPDFRVFDGIKATIFHPVVFAAEAGEGIHGARR